VAPCLTQNIEELIKKALLVNNAKAVISQVQIADRQQLSDMADAIKARIQGIAILYANVDGKSLVVASVFKDLTAEFNATIIIKKIATMIKGKGGGRNDFAQAGGEAIADLEDFEDKINHVLKDRHEA
jgi:alanyl-tRNA synthetase